MTTHKHPSDSIDAIGKLRELRAEAARLSKQDQTELEGEAVITAQVLQGTATTDDRRELTRRRRETREQLDTIATLCRHLEPLAQAHERRLAIDALKQEVEVYESSCAAVVADTGPAPQLDAAIEEIARFRTFIESALAAGDLRYALQRVVTESQCESTSYKDRLGDFDEWILNRLRVSGALRDAPVSSASGYRQYSITDWISQWTNRYAAVVHNTIAALRARAS